MRTKIFGTQMNADETQINAERRKIVVANARDPG